MASTIGRSLRRWGASASASSTHSAIGASFASQRTLSASARRWNDNKPSHSNDEGDTWSPSPSDSKTGESSSSGYQPPTKAGSWPFDSPNEASSSSSAPSSADSASSSEASASSASNPYAGLFDGSDPFPKAAVPDLRCDAPTPSSPSWLSDQLDALSTSPATPTKPPRPVNPNVKPHTSDDGRRRHTVPRSVLFADSNSARQSEDFRPRRPSSASPSRKRFDRTPLTQQEANAFVSLLNQALAGTSAPPTSSSGGKEGEEEKPFGSYTSLISNPRTPTGSKYLLQAFAKRNQLARFEAARAQRAKRFVREGLAAAVDPAELEAGVDEAREEMAMCENLAELIDWAKRQVWGISPSPSPPVEGEVQKPKFGRDTPFYPSVIQLLFLAIRDRYRSPHIALSVARVTRSLGIESYVVGVTGSLYNEVLKTQWDWLGDLQGVVSTLRQARETGILSAPQNTSPTAPKAGFATSEDETIRETVDRIANEVRKHVLDQQMASDPLFKRNYLYGEDVLSPTKDNGRDSRVKGRTDWSQEWLLENAEEAISLAGQPFRLLHKPRRADGDRRGEGGGGGGKPFKKRDSGRYAGTSRPPARKSYRSSLEL